MRTESARGWLKPFIPGPPRGRARCPILLPVGYANPLDGDGRFTAAAGASALASVVPGAVATRLSAGRAHRVGQWGRARVGDCAAATTVRRLACFGERAPPPS